MPLPTLRGLLRTVPLTLRRTAPRTLRRYKSSVPGEDVSAPRVNNDTQWRMLRRKLRNLHEQEVRCLMHMQTRVHIIYAATTRYICTIRFRALQWCPLSDCVALGCFLTFQNCLHKA